MAKRSFKQVLIDGEYRLVESGADAPSDSRLRGPSIIQDTMAPTVHPCDGRTYESKSTFRKVTRAHGCAEIGNESADTLIKDAARNRPDPTAGLREALIAASRGELRQRD